VNKGEPDAFWLSWWADYPDPENFLFPLFHSSSVGPSGNRTRLIDQDLDRIIETAQRTTRKKRTAYRRQSHVRNQGFSGTGRIIMSFSPGLKISRYTRSTPLTSALISR
jgi:hypothetical protein